METKPGTVVEERTDVCTVVDAVDAVGSKWKLVVLSELKEGEMRFNELKRATGASSYTLSRVLDDLRADGFVDRRVEPDAPIASYYSVTEKGEALCPVFDALEAWGKEWL
ncbi:MAG: winged helix-turn-helix transcriptional regulator [Halobacteriales archaeon]